MSVVLAKSRDGGMEPRKQFCNTMIEMAKADDKVVLMDADLMGAIGTRPFQAEFPDRTFNCGIQEADMIGIAAGLSTRGFIPFCHTFGPFASRRACDQIFMSCAYAKQNVKIIGSDPGVNAEINGGTHMPFEDMGIMSTIPEMVVVDPCDCIAVREITKMAKDTYGTWYIRIPRKYAAVVYDEGTTFTLGKANLLKDGKDVTIIAQGLLVAEALDAAAELEKEGISARVLDMWCLKPLDEDAVVAAMKDTGAIVTAENHNIINGLGSAVASCVGRKAPGIVEMVGVKDQFGEVGKLAYLKERFGLTAAEIVKASKAAIARK